jgi:hypothetical protein
MNNVPIEFGYINKKKRCLVLCKFIQDPDGSGLPWIRETGKIKKFDPSGEIKKAKLVYRGTCFDTCEYFSHIGELIKQLVESAPEEAKLMVFIYKTGSGTRTFEEEVIASYY